MAIYQTLNSFLYREIRLFVTAILPIYSTGILTYNLLIALILIEFNLKDAHN